MEPISNPNPTPNDSDNIIESTAVVPAVINKTFGTFQGVFTPTLLTILGVIMYLRHTWIVGNAGVVGAAAIVILAVGITLLTSLSMSSITTNIRIGSGGAFSIISQSLGLEIGGSIGIPLYFSQACAVAMYVFGFREGWQYIFPEHPAIIIDLITFGAIYGITMVSTDFAFKIQYVIMAIVLASIGSIVGGLYYTVPEMNHEIVMIGNFEDGSFWIIFAIFFPAVTGIMAGANMSGELTNPRENIPKGTLSAVVLTGLVYFALVFVAAFLATPEELLRNYNVFTDKALSSELVVAGLLGATFSSGLASFVGAPRILFALGQFNILPKSNIFAKNNSRGEPINATIFTSIVVLLSLLLRDLNAIAPLITMFFMITYAMINVVVLIEQSLGLPSFRPTLRVPIIVPLLGTLGCFFVMFIINPTVSLMSIGVVVTFYGMLLRKELNRTSGDARSGLFTALAQWSTKKAAELSPKREARAWQPELLFPVEAPREVRGTYRLIYSLLKPKGSLKLLGMTTGGETKNLKNYLPDLVKSFGEVDVASSYSIVEGEKYGATVSISMQALETAFFKPNTIFLRLSAQEVKQEEYVLIIKECLARQWGLLLFTPHEEIGLGLEKTINVWVDNIPDDWETQWDLGNNDLSLLITLILKKNWNAKVNLIKTMRTDVPLEEVTIQMNRIKELARLPNDITICIIQRTVEMWDEVPQADLNIMELPHIENLNIHKLQEITKKLNASCVFTLDSGNESALV